MATTREAPGAAGDRRNVSGATRDTDPVKTLLAKERGRNSKGAS